MHFHQQSEFSVSLERAMKKFNTTQAGDSIPFGLQQMQLSQLLQQQQLLNLQTAQSNANPHFHSPSVLQSTSSREPTNENFHVSFITPINKKYWRNDRQNLQCFPTCPKFGDYQYHKQYIANSDAIATSYSYCNNPLKCILHNPEKIDMNVDLSSLHLFGRFVSVHASDSSLSKDKHYDSKKSFDDSDVKSEKSMSDQVTSDGNAVGAAKSENSSTISSKEGDDDETHENDLDNDSASVNNGDTSGKTSDKSNNESDKTLSNTDDESSIRKHLTHFFDERQVENEYVGKSVDYNDVSLLILNEIFRYKADVLQRRPLVYQFLTKHWKHTSKLSTVRSSGGGLKYAFEAVVCFESINKKTGKNQLTVINVSRTDPFQISNTRSLMRATQQKKQADNMLSNLMAQNTDEAANLANPILQLNQINRKIALMKNKVNELENQRDSLSAMIASSKSMRSTMKQSGAGAVPPPTGLQFDPNFWNMHPNMYMPQPFTNISSAAPPNFMMMLQNQSNLGQKQQQHAHMVPNFSQFHTTIPTSSPTQQRFPHLQGLPLPQHNVQGQNLVNKVDINDFNAAAAARRENLRLSAAAQKSVADASANTQ